MRGPLRTPLLFAAAIPTAVAVYLVLALPPRAVRLIGRVDPTRVAGAYHVHSTRSDGTGTPDEIAQAAAEAGLGFVILTDHGDATRPPDAPAYRHGVLIIDAVEINSSDGHIVALGLDGSAPYPLAGPARDVIEDIHRLGGVAVLAHPDSPRPDLRWRGTNVAFDGIEWLNADSEWRDDGVLRLAGAAVQGLIRPAETIASLFARPTRTLQRWDAAARARPVFGIAALDAHARIGLGQAEEPRRGVGVRRPTYAAMFDTVAQVAALEQPLASDAEADAARVLGAITRGRLVSVMRAFATPATLEFTATGERGVVEMGGRASAGEGAFTFRARVPEADGARLSLLRDGHQVSAGAGTIQYTSTGPGVYRVEAYLPGRTMPWILSNVITIAQTFATGDEDQSSRGADRPGVAAVPLGPDDLHWAIEKDASSTGAFTVADGRLAFVFSLGMGVPHGQYAALVTPVASERGIDRVEFTASSSRPLRLSVQVRLPGGHDGERWRRSVYVDSTPRRVSLLLQDFDPVDAPTTRRPVSVPLHSLLFVIDTVNASPGSDATIWLSDLAVGIRGPGGEAEPLADGRRSGQ